MKKILILSAFVMTAALAHAQVYLNPQAPLEERVKDALNHMTTQEKIKILHAQSKFTSAGVPRLGIRQLNMDDGPHGVREELEWNTWRAAGWTNDYIVAFPSLTCLAATWNRDLSGTYGNTISEEFAFRGKDMLLGPGVNIQRTPMNGRAFEYMGEDPYLAGEMVVPYIQAAQRNGVACCLKHFVLNDQEIDRFGVNVNVSERALREIYLYPFEQAVKRAQVWSIMGSYNLWQNVHCCHNDELLNGILKKEWGWDGALVSDWGGTTNTMQAVYGGLDIEMGTYTDGKLRESEFGYEDYYLAKPFEKLVNEEKVPMSVLDEKAARVLRTIFRTAMNPNKVIGNQCSEAHYNACRQIAEEGIVLLKNETSMLPLDLTKYKKILVVGENATRSLTQGGGSSELKTLRDISPLEALQQAVAKANASLSYAQGYTSGRAMYDHVDKVDPAKQEELKQEALEKAKDADLIIFIGGLNKNHKQDCENGDRESYNLSFGQNELIAQLAALNSPMIVVTFGGNPYATPWLNQVQGLLHCWYLGSESGTALANILTGKVNPSGKLPVTFAQKYEDYPYVKYGEEAYPGITGVDTPKNSAGEVARRQVYYKEDLFVGYRGFEKNKTKALFPFGFGLSYTTFKYGKPTIVKDKDGWTLTIDVTNTGQREGKEIVQLYIGQAKTPADRPIKELKNFTKLSLKPGETKSASFCITEQDLMNWDEQTHEWKYTPTKYTAYIGASSSDIKGKISF
ncbi:glycoside hydrolase family 3 protein [Prevotella sp. E2-28]|uniref:beta-glucosidase n=1 Tax=Prevotella sp. E2-28 TaxID=2913620 RepID=UPI001EDA51E3|nr:glycoside hydrolase family 3 C-terminal domain-containing protein [Prevotella sp. E2-28]UKK53429.1 glycoside hydrolase family 3 C-terminal domain-containing protein [Prevotella sp. E2-28]